MHTLKRLVELCDKIQTNDNEDIHIVAPTKSVPEMPPCSLSIPKKENHIDRIWIGNTELNIKDLGACEYYAVYYRTVVNVLPANAR